MKPRARFRLLYWFPVVLAVVFGYVADRRATALRVVDTDKRLQEISKRLDELYTSMQKSGAVERLSAVGNEPRSGESVGGYEKRFVCRPRFIGSGRTGPWRYLDVRHVDGQVCRYYLREDAPPAQVHAVIRTIAEDSKDRAYSVELLAD